MAWIESHQELRNHPKLIALCAALDASPAHMTGHLHWLWWWCLDYAMNGDISRFNAIQIAAAAGWGGDSRKFVDALAESGFIDKIGEKLLIHDWFEFCGEIIRKRIDRKKLRRETAENVEISMPKSSETPLTNQPTEPTEPTEPTPPKGAFEIVWARYPRKLGKDMAAVKFKAQVRTMKEWLDIQNALDHYLRKLHKEKTEEKYIQHGSTWFNNRWHDWVNYEEDAHASNGSQGNPGDSPLARRAREAQGLRKADLSGNTGAVLARIRDRQVHAKTPGGANGAGDPADGGSLDHIRTPAPVVGETV